MMGKTVKLSQEEIEKLKRPIEGQGGWQILLSIFQERVKENGELTIEDDEIEKIRRYAEDYGEGGWESRLEVILNALRRESYPI